MISRKAYAVLILALTSWKCILVTVLNYLALYVNIALLYINCLGKDSHPKSSNMRLDAAK